jgi:PAS domain S-box-containing protein
VLVVDGAKQARALAESHESLKVLALIEPGEMANLGKDIAGFAIKPWAPGELALRVSSLLGDFETPEQVQVRLLATAVHAASDVVEITDPSARMQYVNPAYQQTLGFAPEEVVGKTPRELVRSDYHPPEYFRQIDRTLSVGEVWRGLLVSKAKDGRLVHFEAAIAPIKDTDGKTTHHLAVKRDVTERLKRERALEETNRALEQAKDAAVAASRSKSEFLANMSHELRTPLNAIIGYAELLLEDAEDVGNEALGIDLKKIRTAGAHLLDLINDVLDISKIEAGRMEVYVEPFQLDALLRDVVSTVKPNLVARGNRLLTELCAAGLEVRADERKVRQILVNLLSNAGKFTESGTVTLSVKQEHGQTDDWLCFDVEDTGIGIAEETLARLFRPFVQADASTTRRYGGTGLGLALSRRFAELMGGSISVRSEVGKGSTFSVRLPMVVRVRAGSLRPSYTPGSGKSVLVIDDDETIHDQLTRSLTKRGFRVAFAARGEDGISAARELKPDVIVLDVMMPGMDGWSVLTALKVDAETVGIPVIMMTMTDQRDVGTALGAVDYFVKPVETARLVATIRRHVRAPVISGGPILVVEDDDAIREVMRRSLVGVGYRVVEASNGMQALNFIAREIPAFIVLDLMMPEMDGFQFLDALRDQPDCSAVPVVIVTAKVLTAKERKRLEKSAQSVISKNSHSRTELLNLIGEHVSLLLEPNDNLGELGEM